MRKKHLDVRGPSLCICFVVASESVESAQYTVHRAPCTRCAVVHSLTHTHSSPSSQLSALSSSHPPRPTTHDPRLLELVPSVQRVRRAIQQLTYATHQTQNSRRRDVVRSVVELTLTDSSSLLLWQSDDVRSREVDVVVHRQKDAKKPAVSLLVVRRNERTNAPAAKHQQATTAETPTDTCRCTAMPPHQPACPALKMVMRTIPYGSQTAPHYIPITTQTRGWSVVVADNLGTL